MSDIAESIDRLVRDTRQILLSKQAGDTKTAGALEDNFHASRYELEELINDCLSFAVKQATADAMERAAQIADCHHHLVAPHHPDKPGNDPIAQGYGNAALNIAAAIRQAAASGESEVGG